MANLWSVRTDQDVSYSFQMARRWLLIAIKTQADARLFIELGCVHVALGDVAAATDAFKKALEMDDGADEAMYNLALIYETKQPTKAQSLLEQALAVDPNYFLAHQTLGRIRQRSTAYICAEYHFRRCLDIQPRDYWSTIYLANNLAVTGSDIEAEQLFARAATMKPEMESSYIFYATFLELKGEIERAAQLRRLTQSIMKNG